MIQNIRLLETEKEITEHLRKGIIPFWLSRGIDEVYGGYCTAIDGNGHTSAETDKYIVTQTRMIWGMCAFYRRYPHQKDLLHAAKQGFEFFIDKFWDTRHGGWIWKTSRDGKPLDVGKVVYGQSFAIYALAEYTLATGDQRGIDYASRTFDLLQIYCTDILRGGYYENLEHDWSLSAPGFAAGDRKSLDVHMHLMEAFTVLYQCSRKEIHRQKLDEVTSLILKKMINTRSGCGMNQFDLDLNPLPAISIRRTWNAERATNETIAVPLDTTSYGHNTELAWLLNRACWVMGISNDRCKAIGLRMVDHAISHGLDPEEGGIYRDGLHDGDALVKDKEWWQNCEALVGFLDAYEHSNHERYLEAFFSTWEFAKKHMINHELGEWRQLVGRGGEILVADLGNPWKAVYHSGRAMLECTERLSSILEAKKDKPGA